MYKSDPTEMRRVLGRFASGVGIVASIDDQGPVGFTCQSFFSVSLDPPLVAISVGKNSTSWPRIAPTGQFCFTVLSAAQEALCRAFARSGGDKFSEIAWRPSALLGCPTFPGSLATLECRIDIVHDAGDHDIVLAELLGMEADDGDPLLFYSGQLTGLGAALAGSGA